MALFSAGGAGVAATSWRGDARVGGAGPATTDEEAHLFAEAQVRAARQPQWRWDGRR